MIVDCHGHYTTAPQALWDWRKRQASGEKISEAALGISDDDIRDSLEQAQLKLQRGARQRPHVLLAARGLDGAPRRQRRDQRAVGARCRTT